MARRTESRIGKGRVGEGIDEGIDEKVQAKDSKILKIIPKYGYSLMR